MLRCNDLASIQIVQPKHSVHSISFNSASGLHSTCLTTADLLGAKVVYWVVSCHSVIDTSMYIGVYRQVTQWENEIGGKNKVSLWE